MVNQAHNGYLEIILQLGIVGFVFFLVLIAAYIYRMLKVNNNLAIIVLFSILTLNFTESVMFKVGLGVTTFYFIAVYTFVSFYYFNPYKFDINNENNSEDNSIKYGRSLKRTNSNSKNYFKESSRY
jgi:hypothetical protein